VARENGTATIFGTGARASVTDAAWVNGYSAHATEFDDATLSPVGHPSATILPALFAIAEELDSTGSDLLAAYSVGLEVHARLGQAMASPWSSHDPFLPIGTIGVVAAAVAGSRLLGLDEERTRHAIGLAARSSSQLTISNASHAKPLAAADGSASGARAALLASKGFTGPQTAIEQAGGFGEVFLRADETSLRRELSKLGGPTHLMEVGVAIKRYPSCYACHFSVDGLRTILEAHDLQPEDVRSISLTYSTDAEFVNDPKPSTTEAARFSMQYGLAVTLLDGFPQHRHFTEEHLTRPGVVAILTRIEASAHSASTPTPDRWRHVVELEQVDGRILRGLVPRPHGHPRDPLTTEEVVDKFRDNLEVAGLADAGRLVTELLALDGVTGVRSLLRLLGVRPRRSAGTDRWDVPRP
jgi:2-methylcitrate dehydratase PrpD